VPRQALTEPAQAPTVRVSTARTIVGHLHTQIGAFGGRAQPDPCRPCVFQRIRDGLGCREPVGLDYWIWPGAAYRVGIIAE